MLPAHPCQCQTVLRVMLLLRQQVIVSSPLAHCVRLLLLTALPVTSPQSLERSENDMPLVNCLLCLACICHSAIVDAHRHK